MLIVIILLEYFPESKETSSYYEVEITHVASIYANLLEQKRAFA